MKSDCRATHVSLSHAWLTVNGVEMYTQNACLKTLTYYKTIVQVLNEDSMSLKSFAMLGATESAVFGLEVE